MNVKVIIVLMLGIVSAASYAQCTAVTKETIAGFLTEASHEFGVDVNLLRSIVKVESNFDNCAVSPAGASGLMQLMPSTAKAFDVLDVFDPRQNIRGGAAYLADMIRMFETPQLYLSAYNAGETAVKRKRYVPNYRETRAYIRKVLKAYGDEVGLDQYDVVQVLTEKGSISYEK